MGPAAAARELTGQDVHQDLSGLRSRLTERTEDRPKPIRTEMIQTGLGVRTDSEKITKLPSDKEKPRQCALAGLRFSLEVT